MVFLDHSRIVICKIGLYNSIIMSIQIFGKSKCFDTKKTERYFKERNIKFQNIDVAKYGMSKGEFQSVKAAVGGFDNLIDIQSKDGVHIKYLSSDEDKEDALLANPSLFKTPIVRNGSKATVGYKPEVWKTWE
jgi:arsenate reductase-like glutaredoxin family protein